MAILGIGIDVVEVERMRAAVGHVTRGERFKERVFTAGERAYCDSRADGAPSYAARFAAKEALMKALGPAAPWGFPWHEIEVERDESGRPSIRLHGRTAARTAAFGVRAIHLSLSHERSVAMAQVVVED